SFSQNSGFKMFYGGCNEFVINSVNAKKKITFVHCDFRHYFGNNRYNRAYYRHFDKIACVSDSCRDIFCEVCAGLSEKTFSVHNCFDFKGMENQAKEYKADYTDSAVNILTAARISEEKGIFRMLPILSELKKQGFDFVWRIAGDGPLMERAKAECKNEGLCDNVIFLGMLKNPYPYFLVSDLLLVPSYDEAGPMVFTEAQFFKLPILTTNTTSAIELVKNTGAGIVCENNDEDIKKTLLNILKNPQMFLQKKDSCTIDNKKALGEFANLIM
nr:glycosyltransferase [Bacillota bacterium]